MDGRRMRDYNISTYGGQSGSPVLGQKEDTPVDSHIYGEGGRKSGGLMVGYHGDYSWAESKMYGSSELTVPTIDSAATSSEVQQSGSLPPVGKRESAATRAEREVRSDEESPSPQEESFMDVLKSIAKIGSSVTTTAVNAGTPFLGPIGAPITALAGTALGAAGKLAESSTGSGSDRNGLPKVDGLAERAIVGEAALQTIFKMDPSTMQEVGLLQKMQPIYQKLEPTLKQLAPHVLQVVVEPTRLATVERQQHGSDDFAQDEPEAQVTSVRMPAVDQETAALEPEAQALLERLAKATVSLNDEDDVSDSLGSVITSGLKAERALQGPGFDVLKTAVVSRPPSNLEQTYASHQDLVVLAQRAAMGEAALQALQQLPKEHLEAEGFFYGMTQVIQKIGSAVLAVAPGVIQATTSSVQGILTTGVSGTGDAESAVMNKGGKVGDGAGDIEFDDLFG